MVSAALNNVCKLNNRLVYKYYTKKFVLVFGSLGLVVLHFGNVIPEVHCMFAHPICSLKIPLCLFAKSSRFWRAWV